MTTLCVVKNVGIQVSPVLMMKMLSGILMLVPSLRQGGAQQMPGVCKQCLMADTWFLELYKSVFSVLLGADPTSPGSEFLELDDVYQPALSVSVALLGGKRAAPKVYIFIQVGSVTCGTCTK